MLFSIRSEFCWFISHVRFPHFENGIVVGIFLCLFGYANSKSEVRAPDHHHPSPVPHTRIIFIIIIILST